MIALNLPKFLSLSAAVHFLDEISIRVSETLLRELIPHLFQAKISYVSSTKTDTLICMSYVC